MFSDQEEAQDILSFFQSSFKAFREKPIVLYGLGINTKVLIHNLEDYHIAGVMDAKHEGETFEGLSVLSENEVKQITDIYYHCSQRRRCSTYLQPYQTSGTGRNSNL